MLMKTRFDVLARLTLDWLAANLDLTVTFNCHVDSEGIPVLSCGFSPAAEQLAMFLDVSRQDMSADEQLPVSGLVISPLHPKSNFDRSLDSEASAAVSYISMLPGHRGRVEIINQQQPLVRAL